MKFMSQKKDHIAEIAKLDTVDLIFLSYCVEILIFCLSNLCENKTSYFKKGFEHPFGLDVQMVFYNLVTDMAIPFFVRKENILAINNIDKNV